MRRVLGAINLWETAVLQTQWLTLTHAILLQGLGDLPDEELNHIRPLLHVRQRQWRLTADRFDTLRDTEVEGVHTRCAATSPFRRRHSL